MVHREPVYSNNVWNPDETFMRRLRPGDRAREVPRRRVASRHTLRRTLVLAAAGSIVAAVAVFALAALVLVRHELRSSLDTALRTRAQGVAQLAASAPAVLTDPGALEAPASGRQIAVEVVDARGRILARSVTLGAGLLPVDRVARGALAEGRAGFEDVEVNARPFRLYAAPIADVGGPAAGGAVLVASDTSDISTTIGHLGLVLTLAGLVVVAVAVLVAAALTRRGLRPLRRLAGAAAEIERTADPAARLPESGVSDEIAQLSGVLNRMLASLEQARASERRFLADASHELRTPVTALLGNVEFVARHGADHEVMSDLRRDAASLARLVDDLLVLERAGAGAAELETVSLAELVERVVEDHPGGRVVVERAERAPVAGEPGSLERLLENLIENALVHGPPEGMVSVSVEAAADRVRLTVRDDGPGPEAAVRGRLFERFWRAPEAAARPGSGLGLSIVAALAERHGARVSVEGSAFAVSFPVAPAEEGRPSATGKGRPSPPGEGPP
jgi:signal transduction histidine kinase